MGWQLLVAAREAAGRLEAARGPLALAVGGKRVLAIRPTAQAAGAEARDAAYLAHQDANVSHADLAHNLLILADGSMLRYVTVDTVRKGNAGGPWDIVDDCRARPARGGHGA